jgi:TonB family protein
MFRAWVVGLVFMAGVPLQMKHPSACDHAAPPAGMRWVCANNNTCNCHLVASAGEEETNKAGLKPALSKPSGQCVACRIESFAIPPYPEAARRAQKQGVVSATLVLTPEGAVQDVRIQSGEPVLASAAETALRRWRFKAGGHQESFRVSVTFVLSDDTAAAVTGESLLNTVVTATPLR